LPLHDGDGFVHERYRSRVPEPHDFEHADQSDQGVKPPSTGQQSILHGNVSTKFSGVQFSVEFVLN
jgi:hypothetical protein